MGGDINNIAGIYGLIATSPGDSIGTGNPGFKVGIMGFSSTGAAFYANNTGGANGYDFYASTGGGKSYFAGNVGIGTTSPDSRARLTIAKPVGSVFDNIYLGKRESTGGCFADFEQGLAVGNAGTGSGSSIVGALGYYQCLYGTTGPRAAGYFHNSNNTTYDYSIFADNTVRVGAGSGVFLKNSTPFLTSNGGSIIFGPYDNSDITTATAEIDAV